jgi:hypothetical protein
MNEKMPKRGAADDGESLVKPRASRRVGKVLLMIFVWLVTLEITGIVYCKGLRGVGYWGAQQEREALLQKLPSLATVEDGADTVVVFNGIPREVHPYFGFTLQRDHKDVNNAGFPGKDDYPYRSETNEFVVGIFGGSLAIGQAGSQASRDVLEPGILEHVAAAGFDKVTVLCFASGGWKQPQTFYSLAYYLGMVDMAIVVDGFNDVNGLRDDLADQWPLRYPWMNLYKLLASPKVSHEGMLAIGRIGLSNERLRRVTEGVSHSPLRRSLLVHTLWKSWASRTYANVYEQRQILEMDTADSALDYESLVAPFHDAADSQIDDYLDFYAKLSAWQAKICAMENTPYFHFIQPNQYVRDSKPYTDEEKESFLLGGEDQFQRITKYYERLDQIVDTLSAGGVQASSLDKVFADIPETIYNDSCCHLNDLGKALVSEAMMRHISTTVSTDASGRALIAGQVVQKVATQAGGRAQ